MAADKYVEMSTSGLAEKQAKDSSAGAGDAGKLVALNSSGNIDITMMPPGVAAEVMSIVASEALAANDLVNVYDNSGTPNCRKADASNARPAHGYVTSSVSSSATATIYTDGIIPGSGLTIGARYWLSGTAGTSTTTIPTTATHIAQSVGFAKSATELVFTPNLDWVIRA